MVSSVMYRARWTAHSSFCSSKIATTRRVDCVVVGKDSDDFGPAFDLAVEPFESVGGMDFRPLFGGKVSFKATPKNYCSMFERLGEML